MVELRHGTQVLNVGIDKVKDICNSGNMKHILSSIKHSYLWTIATSFVMGLTRPQGNTEDRLLQFTL